jgi:uncharacterized phage-associated protein
MSFSAAAVANEFLHLAHRDGQTITPLKMQKLVYFAHGWHLAITGKPLISEPIQAWQYGPVISSLYQIFKEAGSNPITFAASVPIQNGFIAAKLDREGSAGDVAIARKIIERVWNQYGKYTAAQLTTLTHSENSPWAKVEHKELPEQSIPNEWIRNYFVHQVDPAVAVR